jgi:hypothetical protein
MALPSPNPYRPSRGSTLSSIQVVRRGKIVFLACDIASSRTLTTVVFGHPVCNRHDKLNRQLMRDEIDIR